MAVAEEKPTSVISDEALQMLDCFRAGLDKVVYDTAESIARIRTGDVPDEHRTSPIEIEPQDVRKAAEYIACCVTEAVASGKIPRAVAAEIEQMVNCCRSHTSSGG